VKGFGRRFRMVYQDNHSPDLDMNTLNVVEAVFFAALEKGTPEERGKYLDHACSGDPNLRRTVEKLLNAHPKAEAFLQPAAGALPPTVDHAADERPGTVLGPYKLLHEIGEGGMGTVWMAEQTEPVRRKVALKVIKPGMDSKQVLARFEAERQALALMDHPNIAKVLDAGATDGGRPYFVMELVKGQPITEFCDKNRLTTRERLELFVAVCNAIQHAHHKGVIHRDIKPSNVLVALYDGKPVPKVIDFGVAKAIGDPLTDKTLFTRHGQVVGTFEYMSPEQATLDQVDVDTRSDVYALGVLLYELLTGTTPLDKDELRQGGLAEVLRRIREQEPPKPSTRLTSSPGLLANAAAHRKTDSQKLPRAVRGELDWIVMKALDKDRNRRFETANGLAADVERFLKDEPVQACPPTLGYRFRKWVRKNKVAFTTGSSIAAALVVGLALTSWQAVRATNAKRETAAAMDKVEDERDEANKARAEAAGRLAETKAALDKLGLAREEMRRAKYAGDMQALPLTWEAGNAAEARQILERQDADLRGFEWHYWNQQLHTERTTGKLQDLPEGLLSRGGPVGGGNWTFSGDGSRIACLTLSEVLSKPFEYTLWVWDAATRKRLLSHPIAVEGLPPDARVNYSSNFSLSHDGKRAAVAGTCYPIPEGERLGGGFGPWLFDSEKDRSAIHVIEVDTKKVIFTDGKKEDSEWTNPRVQLSRDGRKLLSSMSPVRAGEGASLGRITVWDLDSPGKEPVVIENVAGGTFSPDGARVHGQTRTEENARGPKAWDAATGKELPDFSYAGVPSPKGKYVASVTLEGEGESKTRTLKLYDGATRKELSSTPLTGALVGQFPRDRARPVIFPITFSPDESVVAVPHGTAAVSPRIDWYFVETKTGQVLRTLEDPAPTLSPLGPGRSRGARFFSDDGKQFFCVVDNAIHPFHVARSSEAPGRPYRTIRGHVNPIVAATMSPDQRLLTIETDGTLKEWDLPTWISQVVAAVDVDGQWGPGGIQSPTARIGYTVAPGGGHVACVDRGKGEPNGDQPWTVRVWDLAANKTTSFDAGSFKAGVFVAGARGLRLSADGKRVALSRNGVLARDWGAGGVAKVDPQNPPPLPDLTVWEWDAATGVNKQLLHREFPRGDAKRGDVHLWEFSKDGATIVLYRYDKVETLADGRERYRVALWTIDVDTGREGPTLTIDGRLTEHGCLSPDGKRYASFVRAPAADGSWSDQFTVWDLVNGNQVFAVAPIKVVRVGNVNEPSGPGAAFWSPDGSRVAVLNGPEAVGSIALYDAATGKLIRTLTPPTRSSVSSTSARAAFSPNGRRIACEIPLRSGGTVISVLDTESGQEVLSLTPPPAGVPTFFGSVELINGTGLTFSSDGHRLLLFRRTRMIAAEIDGKLVPATALRVFTWDATPRPEPKQP
jgi:serine/threonine protein kinase/WD40 repeat protein